MKKQFKKPLGSAALRTRREWGQIWEMEQGEISGEEGNEETGVGRNEGDRCNISEEELSKNECRGVQGTEEAES